MKRHVGAYVVTYGVFVYALHAIKPLTEATSQWKAQSGNGHVDKWLYFHAFWGVLARLYGLSGGETLGLAVVNEGGEALVRRYRPDLLWGTPESSKNVALDLVVTGMGWALTDEAIRRRPSSRGR